MSLADELLLETSRTFAMAVPLLPEPTRRSTCLAYLLFRISDTFEDATWARAERRRALSEWSDLLGDPDLTVARTLSSRWCAARPTEHAGYLRLLASLPEVLEEVLQIDPGARHIVLGHARRTANGMSDFLLRADESGTLRVRDLATLREYCYTVAGIVGELLTSLFLHDVPELHREQSALRANEACFGEALQLVNILKDQTDDESAGRCFLPPDVPRADVVELCRRDLARAHRYVAALARAGAPVGIVAFTALPAELAEATLRRLERDGPGAKVPRSDVLSMLERYRLMVRSQPPTPRAPTAESSVDSSRNLSDTFG